jgi:hypothetical protein
MTQGLREMAKQITLDMDKATTATGFVPCSELAVGSYYMLRGRLIKMTEGGYWGDFGVSNHWTWRPVLKSGLLGPEKCGYGGSFRPLPKGVRIEETIKVIMPRKRAKKKAKKKARSK